MRPAWLESLALSLHRGMPTRMLEWTKSAFVAAYVAAKITPEVRTCAALCNPNMNAQSGSGNPLCPLVATTSTSDRSISRILAEAKLDLRMSRDYSVVIERDTEGYYVATVPSLPGCHTQAKSLDPLMERIQEAIALCLEVAQEEDEE